jgi:hypothetical protein
MLVVDMAATAADEEVMILLCKKLITNQTKWLIFAHLQTKVHHQTTHMSRYVQHPGVVHSRVGQKLLKTNILRFCTMYNLIDI